MLVKLKGYYNQGGDLLPPETLINLPEEKAKVLIENGGAEVHNPLQKDESKSAENSGKSGQGKSQEDNGGEGTKKDDPDGSAQGSSEGKAEGESGKPEDSSTKKGKTEAK